MIFKYVRAKFSLDYRDSVVYRDKFLQPVLSRYYHTPLLAISIIGILLCYVHIKSLILFL